MATGTAGTAARNTGLQVVHYIKASTDYNDGQTEIITVGTIPAGATIIKAISGVYVNVAFNDATNKIGTVGTSADPDYYDTSASVASIAFVPIDAGVTMAVAADTTIVFQHARTGTAATAGQADIVIAYTID